MSYRTFFPAVEGETATSILAMVARTTDSREAKRVDAGSRRRAAPLANSLPCRVSRFCAITEGTYGTPRHVLTAHSLFPWEAVGMSPNCMQVLERALTHGKSRTPCPRLDVSSQCSNRTALICPECAGEDEVRYGRKANHCPHCIDYVTRCFKHETLLRSAGESSTFEALFIRAGSDRARQNALRYARVAVCLFDECLHRPTWSVIASLMNEKRFVSSSGHWRMADLRHKFQLFFNAGFEDPRLTHIVEDGNYVEAAIRSLRRERPAHPAVVALLYIFATDAAALSVRDISPKPCPGPARSVPDTLRSTQRHEWLLAMSRMTGLSRTQMRAQVPALWVWLYRNDRTWFAAHQPALRLPRGGHKTQSAPTATSDVIAANAADPRCSADGRAPLPSAYQMRVAYGMSEYAFNYFASQLGGVGPTANVPGWKEAFVLKRVTRAADQLASEGKTPADSVVARRANLRPATMHRHRPH
jgi:hypothetical protein